MPSRLESELKQARPFARKSEEVLVSIMRTAAILDHVVQDGLRAFGITPTQYNVLRILRGAGADGLCGREIGERLVSKVRPSHRPRGRHTDRILRPTSRADIDVRCVQAATLPSAREEVDRQRSRGVKVPDPSFSARPRPVNAYGA